MACSPPVPTPTAKPSAPATAASIPSLPSTRFVAPPAERSSCEPLQVTLPPLLDHPLNPPVVDIEDPNQLVMASFYERLARLMRGKAKGPLRIALYGDSNMTLDLISGSMRRTLQRLHGDSGHGYVAIGKPWRWYQHQDVQHGFVGEWATFSPTTVRVRDWAYGLGGIVSATREVGARATFSTAGPDAPVGRTASRFGVFYEVRNHGGVFDIVVDGQKRDTVRTDQGDARTGYHVVRVPDGPHTFEILNASKNLIRIFGVTIEREDPGIVLDCLGIGGISYFDLSRLDPDVNASMLAHRPYDLVMFLIGANTWKAHENPAAVGTLASLHRRHRSDQPILIMSPPDHTKSAGDSASDPQFVRIAAALRKAALDNQCAYWDFRQAMGGEGSMARFFHTNMAAKDLYHFTKSGAAFMGNRAVHALFRGLEAYVRSHPHAGCDHTP